MQQVFEATIAKNTELVQNLLGLGVQNVQTMIEAQQKAFQLSVSALSTVGQTPDFTEAAHVYQGAYDSILANVAQARKLLEDAAKDAQASVHTAVHQGIEKIEQPGHNELATALRSGLTSVVAAQEHVVTQLKAAEKSIENTHAQVSKQVKAAVGTFAAKVVKSPTKK